ncbi:uncharacterized protein I303_102753 [Kwoniella dejecticola CBS 10117]|uniref:Uncharacterized protein n=1 Tax=Kwoniella dejecticola CBS 10117 TaxID=1296121 RepID=A0A1A6A9M4_9TREE|nr:uncharacterized protein I303_02768 [Kwoniella dejecticola CBS 10117]OBR86754.1 hypothetical protein I303_02768 [Kwoniella dejecticola CBS 10117]
MMRTPPRLPPIMGSNISAETPAPTKARINNLQSQVSELVRKNQALERKIQAEKSLHSTTVVEKTEELNELKKDLKIHKRELERCRAEGEGMRDELNLHSIVQQQKALVALAHEQMQIVELEQRLVIAEKARIMRDHKISLFQAKEDDLLAELKEKDALLDRLESKLSRSNQSLTKLQSSSSLTSSAASKELISTQRELSTAQSTINNLESKIETLETKVKLLKEKEKEQKAELDNWLKDEKSKTSSVDKNKKEYMSQIRTLKNDLQKRSEQLEEAVEELEEHKRFAKDRERTLKIKIREANEERDKLLGVEEELAGLKSKMATGGNSPKKVQERIRKTSPVQSSDEEVPAPKKKTKKAESPVRPSKPKSKSASANPSPEAGDSEYETASSKPKPAVKRASAKSPVKTKKTPLETSDVDNQPVSKAKAATKKAVEVSKPKDKPKDKDTEEEAEEVVPAASAAATALPKKKKRLMGGVKSTFEWDPIMGSGDGVIPLGLSPMKPGGRAVGTIPRAGFSTASRLNRLAQ